MCLALNHQVYKGGKEVVTHIREVPTVDKDTKVTFKKIKFT